jgi:hypothetical protein
MDDCMGVYVQAGLQWREADELSRNALEVEAEFLGLIIMQNLGIRSHTSTSPSAASCLTSYTIRLAVTLFYRIFSRDGTTGCMGCDSTEHIAQRLDQQTYWHLAMLK